MLDKWETWWWNDKTYKSKFGDEYHVSSELTTTVGHDVSKDSPTLTLDPVLGMLSTTNDIKSTSQQGPGRHKKSAQQVDAIILQFGGGPVEIPHLCDIWLGFFKCANNTIHETLKGKRETKMLELISTTRSTTTNVLTGVADPASIKAARKVKLTTDMSHHDEEVDISILPEKTQPQGFWRLWDSESSEVML
jgi:hypothetical protein